jgi:hypothetical protein
MTFRKIHLVIVLLCLLVVACRTTRGSGKQGADLAGLWGAPTPKTVMDRWQVVPDVVSAAQQGPVEEWSVPAGEVPVQYEFLGRLVRGQVSVEEQTITKSSLPRLLATPESGSAGCPGRVCGVGLIPVGVPVEAAFWIAVADLYRQATLEEPSQVDSRGYGKFAHVLRNGTGKLQSEDECRQADFTKDLVQFRVSPDVVCQAQFRTSKLLDVRVSPADRAAEELLKNGDVAESETQRADELGVLEGDAGQIMLRLEGPDPRNGGYTLEIHVGHDVASLFGSGETLDHAIRCRSSKPLFAADLTEYMLAMLPSSANEISLSVQLATR